MESQEQTENNGVPITPISHGMNYGAMVGLGMVILSILFYIIDQSSNEIRSYIDYLIILVGLYMGILNYRDVVSGGYLNYGSCIKIGSLISFFAAVIFSFYTYVFFTFIDPDVINVILDQVEQSMIDQGSSDDEIEMAMGYSRQFMTPLMLTIGTLFSYSIMGTVFSLGISFLLKKESDIFQ